MRLGGRGSCRRPGRAPLQCPRTPRPVGRTAPPTHGAED